MTAEMNLLWVHGTNMGYARYGTYLARHLQQLGVDLYDRIEAAPAPAPAGDPRFLLEQEGTERHKKCNVVAWVSVPTHARGWWDGQYPVISTMYEASVLPEAFRETLHNFELVIVPSDQNVELFGAHHPNVAKVPLGVDTSLWRPTARPEATTEFRFLIGGSGPRKGTDLAFRAFRAAFPDCQTMEPMPVLVMKNPKAEDFYAPNVRVMSGRLSDTEEVSLYASCHCYLQPSRGEGFGLQPLQAIAQGMPTILTDGHGHKDFAHLGIGLGFTMRPAQYFIYGDSGDWWEPDFDRLVDAMRYVYNNYAKCVKMAERSAEEAAAEWGWERTAAKFADTVGWDRLEAPYRGSGTWVEPEAKLYRLRVVKDWRADIAGHTHIFQKGVDYWEPADVKRIMFEAGLLDADCVDGDHGLLATQVDRAGLRRAEQSFCPACGQKLGSGTTRADEIIAELEARL